MKIMIIGVDPEKTRRLIHELSVAFKAAEPIILEASNAVKNFGKEMVKINNIEEILQYKVREFNDLPRPQPLRHHWYRKKGNR